MSDVSCSVLCCYASVVYHVVQSPTGVVIRVSDVYTSGRHESKKPILRGIGYLDIQGSVHVSEMREDDEARLASHHCEN